MAVTYVHNNETGLSPATSRKVKVYPNVQAVQDAIAAGELQENEIFSTPMTDEGISEGLADDICWLMSVTPNSASCDNMLVTETQLTNSNITVCNTEAAVCTISSVNPLVLGKNAWNDMDLATADEVAARVCCSDYNTFVTTTNTSLANLTNTKVTCEDYNQQVIDIVDSMNSADCCRVQCYDYNQKMTAIDTCLTSLANNKVACSDYGTYTTCVNTRLTNLEGKSGLDCVGTVNSLSVYGTAATISNGTATVAPTITVCSFDGATTEQLQIQIGCCCFCGPVTPSVLCVRRAGEDMNSYWPLLRSQYTASPSSSGKTFGRALVSLICANACDLSIPGTANTCNLCATGTACICTLLAKSTYYKTDNTTKIVDPVCNCIVYNCTQLNTTDFGPIDYTGFTEIIPWVFINHTSCPLNKQNLYCCLFGDTSMSNVMCLTRVEIYSPYHMELDIGLAATSASCYSQYFNALGTYLSGNFGYTKQGFLACGEGIIPSSDSRFGNLNCFQVAEDFGSGCSRCYLLCNNYMARYSIVLKQY